ncbi:MAG: class I SAM-dependent methyltransferase [Nanoarchaeota archaeon]|nr:class I SAM-dependent methyltransferase [Nanoarchaeota archaeon]
MKSGKIDYGAEEYADTKGFPFRTDIEKYTLFNLLGNPKGMRILDAGCGEGIYSRELIDRGASFVLGVDGAKDFIELANQKNEGYENQIKYCHSLIQNLKGSEDMDAVIASYVLSYPKNLEETISYCEAIASHLKKKGKFVGFNNSPFEIFDGKADYSEYGFEKRMNGAVDGSKVIYLLKGMDNPIVNFYLKPEIYEEAFERAGFSDFKWENVLLDQTTTEPSEYWKKFFYHKTPFIAMTAKKK